MLRKLTVTIFVCAFLSACSIQQSVRPASIPKKSKLCIVKNQKVRNGFLLALQSALSKKGLAHEVVDQHSVPSDCNWSATYTASWNWDMAVYMSYAEIKIYNKTCLTGEAVYDSSTGGLNKFIDAELKVAELVNELISVNN